VKANLANPPHNPGAARRNEEKREGKEEKKMGSVAWDTTTVAFFSYPTLGSGAFKGDLASGIEARREQRHQEGSTE
jgi:hypothetical protein